MTNSHQITYDGILLYVTGDYEEYEDETNSGGTFEAKSIMLQDHESNESNIFFWFGNAELEIINNIVLIENY